MHATAGVSSVATLQARLKLVREFRAGPLVADGWLPAVQAWSLRALAKITHSMFHHRRVIVMIAECNIVSSFEASHVQPLWKMLFDAN
jgi:hypothetical protein